MEIFCSVSVCWTCNVTFHTQIMCSRSFVSLGWGVIYMRHRPIRITGLGYLPPWSSYHSFLRFCNTRLNFSFSSLVMLFTLVHRNNISVSMFGLPLFLPIVYLQLYSLGCLHRFSIIVEISLMFWKPFFSIYYTIKLRSSPNKPIDSSMQSFVNRDNFLLDKNYM